MSIARVVQISGFTGGSPPPEMNKLIDGIRASDGCAAMYTLQNTQDGTGLGISFWRDQDALDAAMSGAIKLANDGARANGLSISPMTVYDVVTER